MFFFLNIFIIFLIEIVRIEKRWQSIWFPKPWYFVFLVIYQYLTFELGKFSNLIPEFMLCSTSVLKLIIFSFNCSSCGDTTLRNCVAISKCQVITKMKIEKIVEIQQKIGTKSIFIINIKSNYKVARQLLLPFTHFHHSHCFLLHLSNTASILSFLLGNLLLHYMKNFYVCFTCNT